MARGRERRSPAAAGTVGRVPGNGDANRSCARLRRTSLRISRASTPNYLGHTFVNAGEAALTSARKWSGAKVQDYRPQPVEVDWRTSLAPVLLGSAVDCSLIDSRPRRRSQARDHGVGRGVRPGIRDAFQWWRSFTGEAWRRSRPTDSRPECPRPSQLPFPVRPTHWRLRRQDQGVGCR